MATLRAHPELFRREFDFHDGSHHQWDAGIKANVVPAVNVAELRADSDIIEWKATQSHPRSHYTDPTFEWMAREARARSFAMHFWYHWISSIRNPIDQAEHFLNTTTRVLGKWPRTHGFVVDAEEKGISEAMCHRFALEVERGIYELSGVGRPGVIYSGLYVTGGEIWRSQRLRFECEFGPRPFHLAAYVSVDMLRWHLERTGNMDTAIHAWQYSSNGPVRGIVGRADMNKMLDRKTYERAAAVPVLRPPVTIPPQEEDPMIRVRFVGYANVFSHNGGSYSHLSEETDRAYAQNKVPLVVSDAHPQALLCALRQSGLNHDDLVPTPNGE